MRVEIKRSVTINDELWDYLAVLAEEQDRTISYVLRGIIRDAMVHEIKKDGVA